MSGSEASTTCRWKTPCQLMLQFTNEALSVRAERKLENRCGADAFEQDAINPHRAWRDHRDCRRDAHGHSDRRNPGWIQQKHGHFRRRCALRLAMAVEACGRLVELSRSQKNQD